MTGNARVLQRQYPPVPGIPLTARPGVSAPPMRHVEVPAGNLSPGLHQHPVGVSGPGRYVQGRFSLPAVQIQDALMSQRCSNRTYRLSKSTPTKRSCRAAYLRKVRATEGLGPTTCSLELNRDYQTVPKGLSSERLCGSNSLASTPRSRVFRFMTSLQPVYLNYDRYLSGFQELSVGQVVEAEARRRKEGQRFNGGLAKEKAACTGDVSASRKRFRS